MSNFIIFTVFSIDASMNIAQLPHSSYPIFVFLQFWKFNGKAQTIKNCSLTKKINIGAWIEAWVIWENRFVTKKEIQNRFCAAAEATIFGFYWTRVLVVESLFQIRVWFWPNILWNWKTAFGLRFSQNREMQLLHSATNAKSVTEIQLQENWFEIASVSSNLTISLQFLPLCPRILPICLAPSNTF